MPTEAIIEAHVDEDLRQEAEQIYAAAGVTIEDMVRRMLRKTVEDQAIPMDFFRPNAETVMAMEAARRGELEYFDSVEALLTDLNAPD